MNKTKWIGVLLAGCMLLGGCATELEEREFPTLLTVSSETDFSNEWLNGMQEGTKKIDYNHLKVILIERSFLEQEKNMSKMLSVLKDDKNVPLNAYVVTTEDLKSITESEKNLDEPLGDYIEKLLEHGDSVKKETYPTIGMLYQEMENQKETLFIPMMSVVKDKPDVTSYEAYRRGTAIGRVESDVALLSFFVGNQLEEYVLQLEEDEYVRLFNTENEIDLETKRDESGLVNRQIVVEIHCDGEIPGQNYDAESETLEKETDDKIEGYMQNIAVAALEQGVDITNSFKKLGSEREWYLYYIQSPDFFEEDIKVIFSLDIDWVD